MMSCRIYLYGFLFWFFFKLMQCQVCVFSHYFVHLGNIPTEFA